MRFAYLMAAVLFSGALLGGCGDDDFNSDALVTVRDLSAAALPDLASSDLAGSDAATSTPVDGGTD